ncbi:AAA family ATPase [Asanoa sp. NPDC050611]|uniref:helix-turn-helix transcriptional regulator n=1 Tax=Asanoa sp. NPDC050611 TaxID=3157098 RepID=UPI0033C084FE
MAGPFRVVGRAAELATAHRSLLADGPGRLLIAGPAGIGKTALLGEIASAAIAEGFRVRSCRPTAAEYDLPFAGLYDLLGSDVEDVSAELSPPLRRALRVALLREDLPRDGQDVLAVNLAVLEALEALLHHHRLLLTIDDVQWLDMPSRRALTFALRRLADRPISTAFVVRGTTEAALELLFDRAVVVELGPLSSAEIEEVVRPHVGFVLPPLRADALHRMSGGIPYLAVEIARTARGLPADVTELLVPARFRLVLEARLAPLSLACRRVLLGAALLSRPQIPTLDRLSGPQPLAEAFEAGVLQSVDGAIRFDHPLLAATVREQATPAQHRQIHAELARLAVDPVERARHLGLAATGRDSGVADEIEAAAHHARASAAIATAAELMRQALTITPHDAVRDRVRRAALAADWYSTVGEVQAAQHCLEPLLKELPPGPERARCLQALEWTLGQEIQRGLALIDEALSQPNKERELTAELLLQKAGVLRCIGDLIGAHAEASAAGAVAAAIPDGQLVARSVTARAEIDLFLGRARQGPLDWGLDALVPVHPDSNYADPGRLRAWAASWADDNATAADILASLIDQAHQAGDLYSEGGLSLHAAEVALRQGRLREATDLAAQGYRLQSDGLNDQFPLYVQAHIAACSGDAIAALQMANDGLRMAAQSGDAIFTAQNLLVLAFVKLSTDDHAAASRYANELDKLLRRMRWGHPGTYRWHADAVEAHLGAGLLDAATSVTSSLWAQADRLRLRGSQAVASRCQGLVNAYTGDTKRALEDLTQSLSLVDGLDIPFERGRTLLALGVTRRRARQKAAARTALEEARNIFFAIGFPLWVERADRELTRAGGGVGEGELTSGERAVAELAAAGATNQEIAGRLFLSPRTVETVLTRVYRKIGVKSRTQLSRQLR